MARRDASIKVRWTLTHSPIGMRMHHNESSPALRQLKLDVRWYCWVRHMTERVTPLSRLTRAAPKGPE